MKLLQQNIQKHAHTVKFTDVIYLCHFFTVFNVFKFFWTFVAPMLFIRVERGTTRLLLTASRLSFFTRLLSSCRDEYAYTYDISTYSGQQWLCELGLGLGFSLRAGRVHSHHIYIHSTCKHHVEKGLTVKGRTGLNKQSRYICRWR